MLRILEKFGGERVLLICEKTDDIPINSKVVLRGPQREMVVEDFCISEPRECFSEPRTTNVILPESYKLKDLYAVEEIDFISLI